MSDNLNKIYSFINKTPNWQVEADVNKDDLLEYNEVKNYLLEHVDWNGETKQKEDLIDQYWNKLLSGTGEEGTGGVEEDVTQNTTRSGNNQGSDVADIAGTVAGIVSAENSLGRDLVDNFLNFGTDYVASDAQTTATFGYLGETFKLLTDQNALMTFADEWMVANNVTEITLENAPKIMADFYKSIGLTFSNIMSAVGIGALVSLAVRIGINTLIDTVPKFAKDVWHNTKETFSNLFHGRIGKFAKNIFIDNPVMLVRNTGRLIKNLAINAYETVTNVLTTAGKGVYETGKTFVSGMIETGKKTIGGFIDGGKKLLKGDIIGAGVSVVKGIFGGAVEGVKTVGKTIGKAIKTVGNVAESVFGNTIKSAGKVVKSVGKAIGKVFKGW